MTTAAELRAFAPNASRDAYIAAIDARNVVVAQLGSTRIRWDFTDDRIDAADIPEVIAHFEVQGITITQDADNPLMYLFDWSAG